MAETRLSAILQTVSHSLLVGAGVVYVFGFAILSISDATYGIANFSLFRTKVVAAGTVFVILCAIGIVVTFRTFLLFGLKPEREPAMVFDVTAKNRFFVIADIASGIPFICWGLVILMGFMCEKYPDMSDRGFMSLIIQVVIFFGVGVLGKITKKFNAYPFLFTSISFINTAIFFVVMFKYADRTFFWFVTWLSMVCFLTLIVVLKFSQLDAARKVEWERLFLLAVPILFFIYATKVYPHLRHEWGGGSPVPVVLHTAKKLPTFDSESISATLVDETEQGYYVLRDSNKAVFISRGMVEQVEFLHRSK